MDVEKEVPYIKLSEQILNENSKSCDENEFNYDLSQMGVYLMLKYQYRRYKMS